MATHKCAICGAEVNLMQQLKLGDGNYICRKNCKKLGLKYFDNQHSDLETVKQHHQQVEFGTKVFNDLLSKDKKAFDSRYYPMYVSEKYGIMALTETRYKFFIFGKTMLACVYKISDLDGYEPIVTQTTGSDGKAQSEYKVHYTFANTFGLCDFDVKSNGVHNASEFKKLKKYYDTFFGIQDTLGNVVNKSVNQINAIKAAASAVKAAANEGEDAEDKAQEAAAAVTKALKGDRTKWIELGDKTLAQYK